MLFSRSVFSLLGRGPFSSSSRRFLSSINVSPPESLPSDIDLTNPLPSTYEEYFNFQGLLKNRNRAPDGFETFQGLRTNPDLVFRDFTPFFQQMRILEEKESKTALLRGRRWGKSVLGQGWLAFLRKEEHLFKGTAVEGKMRKEPLIGIELNLSGCSTIPAVPRNLNYAIIQELRRLRRVGHKIPKWPSGLSKNLTDPSVALDQILEELEDISDRTKLRIALFVDEYDALVIKALFDSARSSKSDPQTQSDDENLQVTDQYRITNEFMTQFFTKLKSMKAIPFQFITGSSRLAIQGFWSGANYITDLSFNPDLAAVLGYTWEQIEQYFPIQLRWLQHLHKLEPEELRNRMEDWYDHHRWSPKSKIHVFNPWSVNKLMETGDFIEHWALTGSNTRVLYSKLLSKELTHLLLSDDQPVTINPSDLVNPRLPKDTERALTSRAQKSLLVGAGMLAMHPDQPSPGSTVYLTIPNREAKLAIFEMLKTGLELPGSFGQAQFESLIADQDFLGLINALDQAGALKATLLSLNDPKAIVSEERLSAAFTMIMQQSELPMIEYRPMAAVSGSRKGRPLTCDQTFHLLDKKTTFVIEFKMTASRQTDTVKRQLIEAFAQCWWRYQDLVKEGFTGAYNVAVFDGASASNIEAEAAMGPLNGTQVENLLSESGFILENLPDKTKGKAPPKEPQAQESQQAQTKKKPPAFNNEQLKQFDLQQWCHKNNVKLYVRPQKPKAAGDSESQVKQE